MTIPWGGVGCCVGAAVLYLIADSYDWDAKWLRSAVRAARIADLAALLEDNASNLPLAASVSGHVGSDTPITCKQTDLQAVVVEESKMTHYLNKDDKGQWSRRYDLGVSTIKEVPWYLDDGTGRVHVVGARGATGGLILSFTSKDLELPEPSFESDSDCSRKFQDLGFTKIESILPTGTSMTVVGEAIKDSDGTIRIQRPKGGPFYVSQENLDHIIENLRNSAWWFKFASIGFAVLGIVIIADQAVQLFLERKRRHDLLNRDQSAAACRQARGSKEDLVLGEARSEGPRMIERTDTVSNRSNICVICLDQEYSAVFIPCGHLCCCMTCSSRLTDCPLCRRKIDQSVRALRD